MRWKIFGILTSLLTGYVLFTCVAPATADVINPQISSGDLAIIGDNAICAVTRMEDGQGITAAHCGRAGDSVRSLQNPSVLAGTIIGIDSDRDLAWIHFSLPGNGSSGPGPVENMACIQVSGARQCGQLTQGTAPNRYWMNGVCSVPGMSGSPVLNDSNEVIGIVKGQIGALPCLGPVGITSIT